ncbi:leucine-rich repeat domain-containing protein [Cellulophaga omnivescoria]|uniref:leucine-rich repeat domain-containing protein n=1 Tax=Cellulophaga omnivescoria TaxID=1888890 RepID=UPI000986CA37|nr:leucine-rich repeat domain-containing protein [Cellulophaga omnivescoria]
MNKPFIQFCLLTLIVISSSCEFGTRNKLSDYSSKKLTSIKELHIRLSNKNKIPTDLSEAVNLKYLYLYNATKFDIELLIQYSPKIEFLWIESYKDAELPNSIFTLTSLTDFIIIKNNLKFIPIEIEKLTNLEGLIINNTLIEKIPEEICNLTNLVKLDLSSNSIIKLPKKISNLTNLKYLLIEDNHIEEIPNISSLKKLESLFISENDFDSIPEEIYNYSSVKYLRLIDHKMKGKIEFNKFNKNNNLTQLILSCNLFKANTNSIKNIPNLKLVRLTGIESKFQNYIFYERIAQLLNIDILTNSETKIEPNKSTPSGYYYLSSNGEKEKHLVSFDSKSNISTWKNLISQKTESYSYSIENDILKIDNEFEDFELYTLSNKNFGLLKKDSYYLLTKTTHNNVYKK